MIVIIVVQSKDLFKKNILFYICLSIRLCHPGPCPTCTAMIKRSCLCGRESRTIMCSSNSIIRCENKCGKLKSCQHHICNLVNLIYIFKFDLIIIRFLDLSST
jgi:hypothetical protein